MFELVLESHVITDCVCAPNHSCQIMPLFYKVDLAIAIIWLLVSSVSKLLEFLLPGKSIFFFKITRVPRVPG